MAVAVQMEDENKANILVVGQPVLRLSGCYRKYLLGQAAKFGVVTS